MPITGGWDRVDVAKAQLRLVTSELQNADHVLPFAEFVKAMEATGVAVGRLLDVGCGVGHYGVLCERHFPFIKYHGTDASAAIIAEAQLLAPLGVFEVREFADNDFEWFDIVLASQVIEIAGGDCFANLCLLLSRARHFVILNRIRLADNRPSYAITETTYCGCSGHEWLWNLDEIEHVILKYGKIIHRSIWDNGNQATFVINLLRGKNG